MKKHSNDVVMFLKFFVVFLCLSLFASLMPSIGIAYDLDTPFIGDIDQKSVPKNAVHIQTATQLANIGGIQSEGKYYVLDNDINLVTEWVPIDDFRGTFDGQGYSINGLYVLERSKRWAAGLFGQVNVDGVAIKNVGVNIHSKGLTASAPSSPEQYDDIFVEGLSRTYPAYVGGLIGLSSGGVSVVNCYVTGDVTAVAISPSLSWLVYAGGLVGYNYGSTVVEHCYVMGDVAAVVEGSFVGAYVGGLVGSNYGHVSVVNSYTMGDITISAGSGFAGGLVGGSGFSGVSVVNCYATGDITVTVAGAVCVGGLIGESWGGGIVVMNSYATGDVTASSSDDTGFLGAIAGGLVGRGAEAIMNSYATGDVVAIATSGHGCAGGLVGAIVDVNVANSYATGDISASGSDGAYVGGLVGLCENVVAKNSYRLSTQKITGATINDAGKPLSSEEMKNQQSFVGWNFRDIWAIDADVNEGYPYLTMALIMGDEGDLFGSFWFVTLLLLLVGVIVVVVLFFCFSRRRKQCAVVDGGLLNSGGSLEGYV